MNEAPRRPYGWGKAIRLRKHAQFSRVQSKGRRLGGKFLLLIFAPKSVPGVRHGLTVSKRVGNAVTRNKVKRRLRNILRTQNVSTLSVDLVWIARPDAANAKYADLHAEVYDLLERLKRHLSCPHT